MQADSTISVGAGIALQGAEGTWVSCRKPSSSRATHTSDHGETRVTVDDSSVPRIGILVVVIGIESIAEVRVELDETSGGEGQMLRRVKGEPSCQSEEELADTIDLGGVRPPLASRLVMTRCPSVRFSPL